MATNMTSKHLTAIRRNRIEVALVRQCEDTKNSLGRMIEEAFPDEESLFPIQPEMVQSELKSDTKPKDRVVSTASFNDKLKIKHGTSASKWASTGNGMGNIPVHPWNVVDFHLYLAAIEGSKTQAVRRDSVFFFTGNDCTHVPYEELFISDDFDLSKVSSDQNILFAALPLVDGPTVLEDAKYVLGFNIESGNFFVRQFDKIPESFRDIDKVWEKGADVYTFSIEALHTLLKRSITGEDGEITVPRLHVFPSCHRSSQYHDPPGLDIVIEILCGQFAVDFAQVLFSNEDDCEIASFKRELVYYMEEWRLILERASYKAWFAYRDGMSRKGYIRKWSMIRAISSVFALDANQRVSYDSIPCSPDVKPEPMQDYSRTREEEEDAINQIQEKFDQLFAQPIVENGDSNGSEEGRWTKNPVADITGGNGWASNNDLNANQVTYSNSSACASFGNHALTLESRTVNTPMSPGTVTQNQPPTICSVAANTNSTDRDDNQNSIRPAEESPHIPIHATLSSLVDLVSDYPGLDTPENRIKINSLLADMGIIMVDELTSGKKAKEKAMEKQCLFTPYI